ncbi:hypothetical protein ED236_00460 [Pseudomethylobacillus aquaticus]|uniref:Uncharacterized protein n=1 Tax=Pseudomethylobacillus aquaticus TaxID=2676064 RepID=A0A3N0V5B4_9PROT|nr:hypothetical protein [Pseudomethylobacillus aquaticus]ROH88000.1 hypothetical protein ED236_00460 [Pseudomethylobacillus aquaticus]
MAIQEDAVNNETSNANEEIDPIELIAQKAEAKRDAEMREAMAEMNQPEDTGAGDEAQQQIEAANIIENVDNVKVKVKLEGQEVEMPLADVIRSYQKESVATRRLQEATNLKKEAEALLEKARAGGEPAAANQATQTPNQDDATGKAKSVVNSLLEGDEDAAVKALMELTAGRENATQSTVDTGDVAAAVKQQLDVDSALSAFEKDYSDVLADPYLANMTNTFLRDEMDSGIHASPLDAMKVAGNKTRDWLASMGVVSQEKSSTIRDNRVAAKAGMQQIPALSASAGNGGEKPETASSVIQQMKRDRGLLVD